MAIQITVYLIGVFVLGLFYSQLKSVAGGGIWFVLSAIVYLIMLRLVGHGITRLVRARDPSGDK